MQRSRATYDDLAISERKINDTPQMPLNCLMTPGQLQEKGRL
jgi:hypothetical protein